ncbi:hypothetical protein ASG29_14375 [Sphingomonas sp. Leaf412]|uniref:O-antigen ligase family protein n=1 Tax=Sphingomonas sp. Leaf412 TaxID=1736370 RepID=UPI0006F2CB61|nr:O-antigen ligase family protein [Sphingomonas sp. Leaf412]KQT31168.1 hypothetical protein ASG29_14375 [Sphingomonas sp. Leaf412]
MQGTRKAWGIFALLTVIFLFGGGSRGDIAYLILLRPLTVMVGAYALWRMTREERRGAWPLLAFLGIATLLILSHLLPLPPPIWTRLPGREIVVEIDRMAGLGLVWRPLSLSPSDTWNALFSMSVPSAVLLLTLRLDEKERWTILPFLIVAALVSGLLGILQIMGGDGTFNIYGLRGEVTASGLFTNRNHAAVFLGCVPPMLAVWASNDAVTVQRARFHQLAAGAIALATIPLILVTGSRAGLIAGVIGFAAAMALYRAPALLAEARRPAKHRVLPYALAGVVAVVLAAVTVLMSRGEAFDRLFAHGGSEIRFRMWGPIAQIGARYFPFGSGFGSFERVYQVYEPNAQLRTTYANHAHNDWLEMYMTGGVPGILLLVVAFVGWAAMSYSVWRKPLAAGGEVALGRLATVMILILGIASLGDYPLRVPSLASVAAVAVVWLYRAALGRLGHTRSGG